MWIKSHGGPSAMSTATKVLTFAAGAAGGAGQAGQAGQSWDARTLGELCEAIGVGAFGFFPPPSGITPGQLKLTPCTSVRAGPPPSFPQSSQRVGLVGV